MIIRAALLSVLLLLSPTKTSLGQERAYNYQGLIESIDAEANWHNRYETKIDTNNNAVLDLEVYLWIMNGWLNNLQNPPRLIDNIFAKFLLFDHMREESFLVTIRGITTRPTPENPDPPHMIIAAQKRLNTTGLWKTEKPSETLGVLARRYSEALGTYPQGAWDKKEYSLKDGLLALFPNPPRSEQHLKIPLDAKEDEKKYAFVLRQPSEEELLEWLPQNETPDTAWEILFKKIIAGEISRQEIFRFILVERWNTLKFYGWTVTGQTVTITKPPHFILTNYSNNYTVMGRFLLEVPGPRIYDILRIPARMWTDRDK